MMLIALPSSAEWPDTGSEWGHQRRQLLCTSFSASLSSYYVCPLCFCLPTCQPTKDRMLSCHCEWTCYTLRSSLRSTPLTCCCWCSHSLTSSPAEVVSHVMAILNKNVMQMKQSRKTKRQSAVSVHARVFAWIERFCPLCLVICPTVHFCTRCLAGQVVQLMNWPLMNFNSAI